MSILRNAKSIFSDSKSIILSMTQIVTVIISAFGGFFERALPESISISALFVGGSSFASLAVLMIIKISVSGRVNRHRIFKLLFALGIVIFFLSFAAYSIFVGRYVFTYPSSDGQQYIAGLYPIDYVAQYAQEQNIEEREYEQLIEQFAAADQHGRVRIYELWSRSSVESTQLIILVSYLGMILGISTSIFLFLEIIALPKRGRRRDAPGAVTPD